MATSPDTQKYYVEMARKLEALSDYARSDPEINPKVAEHLKSFAENILKDVTRDPSRTPTAILACSLASRLSRCPQRATADIKKIVDRENVLRA